MKPLLLLIYLLPFFAFAQKNKKDTIWGYLNNNLEFTTAKNGIFPAIAIKQNENWLMYAVYPDSTPVLKAYFKDKFLKIKDGPYVLFYPKYKKAKERHYQNNSMTGIWRFWYINGVLKDSGLINNNYIIGNWKSWADNGQLIVDCNFKEVLSTNEMNILYISNASSLLPPYNGLRSGSYSSWYTNGQLESSGAFSNNKYEGLWKWYHENGSLSTIEEYKNGLVTNLRCFDTAGIETNNLCSISKPPLLKNFGDYRTFIHQNLTWPAEAIKNNIEGTVQVNFFIDANGNLQNLVINTDEPVLKKAVMELFEKMKVWEPAISHNRIIDWEETMTIPFFRKK